MAAAQALRVERGWHRGGRFGARSARQLEVVEVGFARALRACEQVDDRANDDGRHGEAGGDCGAYRAHRPHYRDGVVRPVRCVAAGVVNTRIDE